MTFNYNRYIEELLEQEQQNQGSPYQNLKRMTGKVYKTGKNMANVGDYMQNNFSNPTMQKVGSFLNKNGQSIANGANNVNNVISPQNYFKGFAPKPFSSLSGSATSGTAGAGSGATAGGAASTVGTLPPMGMGAAAGTGAGTSAIGNAIGSEVAGTAAGGSALTGAISSAAPMATTAGLGAGTAAGAGSLAGGTAAGGAAAGAGGAAAGGAAGAGAGGAAAGGAAAGGGAASGAAAAGPIGALVALGVMAAMGTNRKRAKKSGQALLSSLNKEGEAALNQTNEFAKNANNQIQDYSQQMLPTNNGPTGGAAPVQQQLSPIQEYQNYLRSQGYDENVINGVPQGLNSGNKDIADWINQYNSGAGKDNPINIPQTEEDIAAAKAGSFNVPTQNAEATLKQGILDKFLSGIGDLASGFQENRNNGFKAENLQRDDSKSKMNRIGEALGTTARIAQNPLVQGLVAGGLSTALTGNPLFGLGKGYEFANNRAMSNLRAQALRDYGINAPDAGMFGNYSSNDFNTIGNLEMKNITNQLLRDKLAESENYHRGLLENKENALQVAKDKMAADNNYKAQKLALDKEKVAAYKDSVKNRGGNPEMNSDLAEYFEIMKGSDENAKNYARKTFITRYGKDPDKLFKSDDTTLLLQALLGD